MEKYIGLLLVLCLVLSCSKVDNKHLTEESTREIALSVIAEEPITIHSRALEKKVIHYFIFDEQGNLVHRVSGENGDTYVTLSEGHSYKCYAVMAYDNESLEIFKLANTENKIRELTLIIEDKEIENQGLVMTGQELIGPDAKEISVKVCRLYAKIEIVFNTDELATTYGYEVLGVKAYNVPKQVHYFDPDKQVATTQFFFEPIELKMTGDEYVLYMLENSAGERKEIDGDSGDWSNQKEKKTYAPQDATYVCVEGEMRKEGRKYKTIHWIYLGKNNSYDYNVGRNHRQTHQLTIKGFSEDDARVEVIEEYMF